MTTHTNTLWQALSEGGRDKFVTEASDLGDDWTDPWGAPLDVRKMTVDCRDGDVVAWYQAVQHEGRVVSLVVFND